MTDVGRLIALVCVAVISGLLVVASPKLLIVLLILFILYRSAK